MLGGQVCAGLSVCVCQKVDKSRQKWCRCLLRALPHTTHETRRHKSQDHSTTSVLSLNVARRTGEIHRDERAYIAPCSHSKRYPPLPGCARLMSHRFTCHLARRECYFCRMFCWLAHLMTQRTVSAGQTNPTQTTYCIVPYENMNAIPSFIISLTGFKYKDFRR